MTEIRRDPIKQNEIDFCEFWMKEVITRKDNISTTQLDKASSLLGMHRTGNCSACMRNDAISFNNRFKLLLPAYKVHKELEVSKKMVGEDEPKKVVEIIQESKKEVIEVIKEEKKKITKPKAKRTYKRKPKK